MSQKDQIENMVKSMFEMLPQLASGDQDDTMRTLLAQVDKWKQQRSASNPDTVQNKISEPCEIYTQQSTASGPDDCHIQVVQQTGPKPHASQICYIPDTEHKASFHPQTLQPPEIYTSRINELPCFPTKIERSAEHEVSNNITSSHSEQLKPAVAMVTGLEKENTNTASDNSERMIEFNTITSKEDKDGNLLMAEGNGEAMTTQEVYVISQDAETSEVGSVQIIAENAHSGADSSVVFHVVEIPEVPSATNDETRNVELISLLTHRGQQLYQNQEATVQQVEPASQELHYLTPMSRNENFAYTVTTQGLQRQQPIPVSYPIEHKPVVSYNNYHGYCVKGSDITSLSSCPASISTASSTSSSSLASSDAPKTVQSVKQVIEYNEVSSMPKKRRNAPWPTSRNRGLYNVPRVSAVQVDKVTESQKEQPSARQNLETNSSEEKAEGNTDVTELSTDLKSQERLTNSPNSVDIDVKKTSAKSTEIQKQVSKLPPKVKSKKEGRRKLTKSKKPGVIVKKEMEVVAKRRGRKPGKPAVIAQESLQPAQRRSRRKRRKPKSFYDDDDEEENNDICGFKDDDNSSSSEIEHVTVKSEPILSDQENERNILDNTQDESNTGAASQSQLVSPKKEFSPEKQDNRQKGRVKATKRKRTKIDNDNDAAADDEVDISNEDIKYHKENYLLRKRSPGRPFKRFIDDKRYRYPCGVCGKRWSGRQALKIHMRIHTGECPYECSECGQKFRQKGSLGPHMLRHKGVRNFTCEYCDYKSFTKGDMNTHKASVHFHVRRYFCEFCGMSFKRTNTLIRHQEAVHGDRSKRFPCHLCDFRTHTQNILSRHIYNMHTRTEDDDVMCDICGTKLKNNGSLLVHRRGHFGVKPYRCSVCNKQFVSSSRLATHKKTHETPKEKCPVCGKLFIDKYKLARHSVVHTGEKNFSCEHCPYKCNVKHNLNKHYANVHKVKLPVDPRVTRIVQLSNMELVDNNFVKPDEVLVLGQNNLCLGAQQILESVNNCI